MCLPQNSFIIFATILSQALDVTKSIVLI